MAACCAHCPSAHISHGERSWALITDLQTLRWLQMSLALLLFKTVNIGFASCLYPSYECVNILPRYRTHDTNARNLRFQIRDISMSTVLSYSQAKVKFANGQCYEREDFPLCKLTSWTKSYASTEWLEARALHQRCVSKKSLVVELACVRSEDGLI